MEIVIPPFDLKSISLIIILTISAIFILVADVFFRKKFKDSLGYLSFLIVVITGMVAFQSHLPDQYGYCNPFIGKLC